MRPTFLWESGLNLFSSVLLCGSDRNFHFQNQFGRHYRGIMNSWAIILLMTRRVQSRQGNGVSFSLSHPRQTPHNKRAIISRTMITRCIFIGDTANFTMKVKPDIHSVLFLLSRLVNYVWKEHRYILMGALSTFIVLQRLPLTLKSSLYYMKSGKINVLMCDFRFLSGNACVCLTPIYIHKKIKQIQCLCLLLCAEADNYDIA